MYFLCILWMNNLLSMNDAFSAGSTTRDGCSRDHPPTHVIRGVGLPPGGPQYGQEGGAAASTAGTSPHHSKSA